VGDFSIFTEKFVLIYLRYIRFIALFINRLRNLYNYYKLTFPDLDMDIEKTIEQFRELADYFRPMIIDTIAYLNQAILDGSKKILVEGANATMLDIDFGKFTHHMVTKLQISLE
jgi:adenylosuccinate synthase